MGPVPSSCAWPSVAEWMPFMEGSGGRPLGLGPLVTLEVCPDTLVVLSGVLPGLWVCSLSLGLCVSRGSFSCMTKLNRKGLKHRKKVLGECNMLHKAL